jgi:hypothetical protein
LLQDLGIPTAIRGVLFARQAPGSSVNRHSDGRNFVLTAHLGLKVPFYLFEWPAKMCLSSVFFKRMSPSLLAAVALLGPCWR